LSSVTHVVAAIIIAIIIVIIIIIITPSPFACFMLVLLI